MAKRQRRWVWVRQLAPEQKVAIAAACERVIADSLKPRFVLEGGSDSCGPLAIFGKWRASKYSFIAGYRDDRGAEFDAAFARLDHAEECLDEVRFDVMWPRHTGQWWRLHSCVTLEKALRLIATEPLLNPPL